MITKNLGMLLLAIYLILVGIMALFHVGIPVIVTGILALVAGHFDSDWQIEYAHRSVIKRPLRARSAKLQSPVRPESESSRVF